MPHARNSCLKRVTNSHILFEKALLFPHKNIIFPTFSLLIGVNASWWTSLISLSARFSILIDGAPRKECSPTELRRLPARRRPRSLRRGGKENIVFVRKVWHQYGIFKGFYSTGLLLRHFRARRKSNEKSRLPIKNAFFLKKKIIK